MDVEISTLAALFIFAVIAASRHWRDWHPEPRPVKANDPAS
jgi:hypothetical protein